MTLLAGQQGLYSGRDDPLTDEEIRLAAYRYTSRITDTAWEPSRVKSWIGPVESYLKASESRADFETRCLALEEQTTNLGLHPLIRNPGAEKKRSDLPSPEKLVGAADKIRRYIIS